MNSPTSNTIVLIHGLWMTPQSWDNFRSRFEQRGYRVFTPAWPRLAGSVAEARLNPSALDGLGLREIADHYEKFIRTLDEAPILVGHSMGGLVVQMLLDRGVGAAGVAIEPGTPKGILRLPLTTLRSAFKILANPFNFNRTPAFSFEQFRYAFANNMSEADARVAYDRDVIPGPARPLFEVATANFNPWTPNRVNFKKADRAPLLFIAGSDDHIVPPAAVKDTFKKHAASPGITDYKEFAGRSHLIAGQRGWEEVADYALDWTQLHIRPTHVAITQAA
ncbi:alpha/beta hydrolase [Oleiharenicola lentus]|uniref:alpha/beta hydrolase n=1 Tax=Oleiharenicola lentus TaxID=2508720 RepID=UPI003F665C9A